MSERHIDWLLPICTLSGAGNESATEVYALDWELNP